jgi:hypothetical protein
VSHSKTPLLVDTNLPSAPLASNNRNWLFFVESGYF